DPCSPPARVRGVSPRALRRARIDAGGTVTSPMASPTDSSAAPPDPAQLLRSRSYIVVLVFGAVIGAPVAAIAYFFLKAVSSTTTWVFTTLPGDLGFSSEPP